mmetsp:Transcript_81264/g.134284  ORF Transcript_81264/g.134284 Transcript_81264/m.134284 type:complete len:103 (-) Transcript_81264:436-744(-)
MPQFIDMSNEFADICEDNASLAINVRVLHHALRPTTRLPPSRLRSAFSRAYSGASGRNEALRFAIQEARCIGVFYSELPPHALNDEIACFCTTFKGFGWKSV